MATATSNAVITFPNTVAVGSDATHFSIARGGTPKVRSALTGNPAALQTGQFYRFASGMLSFEIPVGTGLTASGAQDAVNGILGTGNVAVRLHSGDPGAAGTANLIPNATVDVAATVFTVA